MNGAVAAHIEQALADLHPLRQLDATANGEVQVARGRAALDGKRLLKRRVQRAEPLGLRGEGVEDRGVIVQTPGEELVDPGGRALGVLNLGLDGGDRTLGPSDPLIKGLQLPAAALVETDARLQAAGFQLECAKRAAREVGVLGDIRLCRRQVSCLWLL